MQVSKICGGGFESYHSCGNWFSWRNMSIKEIWNQLVEWGEFGNQFILHAKSLHPMGKGTPSNTDAEVFLTTEDFETFTLNMNGKTFTLVEKDEQLIDDAKFLTALMSAGVDSWDGYEFACDAYEKKN